MIMGGRVYVDVGDEERPTQIFGGIIFIKSKNFPTYPWNIPQTQNQQFMKEFLSFGGLGRPGVCSRGMLGFS